MEREQKMKDDIIDECEEDGNDNDSKNEEPIKFTNGSTHHELSNHAEKQDSPRFCSDSTNQEKVNQNELESQDSNNLPDRNSSSGTNDVNDVDEDSRENSEISRLQLEIEEKNSVLMQLKAELQRQEDYRLLQEQYKNLRSSLDKQTEAEENLKLETTTSKDQEMPQESVAVDSSIQESSSELDLLKKLQVLQNMNPAIKALMNYRGLSAFPWIINSDKEAQKSENGYKSPNSDFSPGLKNMPSSPVSFSPKHTASELNSYASPITSPVSPYSTPLASPLTSCPVPMFQNIFSQQQKIGQLKGIDRPIPPMPIKLPGELHDQKPFWPAPFNPPLPLLKEKHEFAANRPDFNGKIHSSDLHPFSRIGYPPSSFMSGHRIPKFDPLEGQLQDMLRYNMERYGGGAFDTIECARRVREILSVHNIGQRLFAKYVLGLSQGTVSELLSKPKCWEKLTEKGRDSYRKMHAWVYDERAIAMLKTLIPRKSELVRAATSTSAALQAQLLANDREGMKRRYENSFSHIISEAENHSSHLSHIPISHETMFNRKDPSPRRSPSHKDEMEDIKTHDTNLDCFQKEEASPVPSIGIAGNNEDIGHNNSDIKRAIGIYHNELCRLQEKDGTIDKMKSIIPALTPSPSSPENTTTASNTVTRTDKEADCTEKHIDIESESSKSDNMNNYQPIPSLCAVSQNLQLVPPSKLLQSPNTPSSTDFSLTMSSSHPLQQIASITNSLHGKPQPNLPFPFGPPMGSLPIRPYKSILQPLNQAQIDRYETINTDDVVRQVKDLLSSYSISQRLFGEACLGLSQGSVSDLLARPKPFHMLTQKGKEPFIRMKIFLEDDTAMHRLVASQYNVSPDKLLRTQTYTGPPGLVGIGTKPAFPLPPSLDPADASQFIQNFMQSSPSLKASTFPFHHMFPFSMDKPNFDALPLTSIQKQLLMEQHQKRFAGESSSFSDNPSHRTPYSNINLSNIGVQQPEVNTNEMVLLVKSLLAENNIAQKVFGKYVLCLSQGSVSEIMNKPKPWHMLSIKGREPYVRMQMWLKDPNNIEKLKHVHNTNNHPQRSTEPVETNKTHEETSKSSDAASLSPASLIRSPCAPRDANSPEENICNDKTTLDSPDNGKNESNDHCNDDDDVYDAFAAKRQKIEAKNESINIVSSEQRNVLNEAFSLESNPNPIFLDYLSKYTKIDPAFLANWLRTQHSVSPKEPSSSKYTIDKALTESKNCT